MTLTAGVVLAAAALGALGVSLHYAELLADWRLPGLAALLAIASNVAFMTAAQIASRPDAEGRR